jgi:molecular chaperone GrpE (heat shock protein)
MDLLKGAQRLTVDQIQHMVEATVILAKVADAEARRQEAKAEMKRLRAQLRNQHRTFGQEIEPTSATLKRAERRFKTATMARLRALRRAIEWQERTP